MARSFLTGVVFLLTFLSASSWPVDAVGAQSEAGTEPPEVPDLEAWKADRDAALEAGGEEEVTAEIAKSYDTAIAAVAKGQEFLDQARQLAEELTRAPARLQEIEQKLAEPAPDLFGEVQSLSAQEQQGRLEVARADLAAANEEDAKWAKRISEIETLVVELPDEMTEARQALNELIESTPPTADDPRQTRASEASRAGRQFELEAKLYLARQRLQAGNDHSQWLQGEKDFANHRVEELEERVQYILGFVQQVQVDEAERSERDARADEQLLSDQPEFVTSLARENTRLAGRQRELAERAIELADQVQRSKELITDLRDEFELAEKRVQREVSEVFALVLRQRRQSLQSAEELASAVGGLRDESDRLSLEQLELAQARKLVLDQKRRDRRLESLSQSMPPDASVAVRQEARQIGAQLLEKQLGSLNDLAAESKTVARLLVELRGQEQERAELVERFHSLIEKHLLWIRSAPVVGIATVTQSGAALGQLLRPSIWSEVVEAGAKGVRQRPASSGFAFLVLLGLFWFRTKAIRAMQALAPSVGKLATDSFGLTLKATGATLLAALPLPTLLGCLGALLLSEGQPGSFPDAVGIGLVKTAWILAAFLFLRTLCLTDGLGHRHFRWGDAARQDLLSNLAWLVPLGVPLSFLVWTLESYPDDVMRNSLGRVCFLIGMVFLSAFAARVLRPGGGPIQTLLRRSRNGWTARLRWLWYPLAIVAPLAMAGLTAAGYFYSAFQLDLRLEITVFFFILALIVYDLLMRWLRVAYTRMRYQEALRKRELARQAEASMPSQAVPVAEEPIVLQEHEVALSEVNKQTARMIRVTMGFLIVFALWWIWADILPALKFLDRFALWTYTVDDVEVPVTLLHVVTMALFLVLTLAAARNLPGLLEITLLNRLGLEPGTRYAIASICRYVITGVGIVMACNVVGVGWSNVQWLVAALSVGLGFGLQEIFANFVSGLILLFERPVRVGDIVTVAGTTGIVSRIQIRATTITDWDRKELIVPNKDFVTGHVLNWTLSSQVNRVLIQVGAAYGSDTEKARDLLLRVAVEHPRVLEDPAPVATFGGFGDNTLDFTLRCYLPNLDNRLSVIHDLHTRINREFNEAGIEIAFPQRDVHLDVTAPVPVRIQQES